ncbi:MAG: hypothetical protein PF795_06875 [Kiritimatiellae bacterium]|jgi:glutamyl endopeptidase|nr:hypothetical protein [Kiritimatiellia bacterium]
MYPKPEIVEKPKNNDTEDHGPVDPPTLKGSEIDPVSDEYKGHRLIVEQRTPVENVALRTLSIIDNNDLNTIDNSVLWPWRMICNLEIFTHSAGIGIGTGWFVGPRTIATAGHNLYHPDFGGDNWATEIKVHAGLNNSQSFGKSTSRKLYSNTIWKNDQSSEFDYGAIVLSENICPDWFWTVALPKSQLMGKKIHVAGYPKSNGYSGGGLFYNSNLVAEVSSRRIFYTTDTLTGMSGAPIWIYENGDTDAPPKVVGIHGYNTDDTPAHYNVFANSGVRITSEVIDFFKACIDKAPA